MIARHVFHSSTNGTDHAAVWQESTHEPVFTFGSRLSGNGKTWFYSVKREFAGWLNKTSDAQITVYHDGLGSDCLGPMDPCAHKVMLVHNWFPRWKQNFEWMIRSTGKVIVLTEEHRAFVGKEFPWIPDRYTFVLRSPTLEDSLGENKQAPDTRRTGIWLHGENWKRFGNRLRRVVDQWPAEAGELEVICSGKKGFKTKEGSLVKWSLDLPLEFALLRLYTWDSFLSLNDYSLQAPWLQNALKLGLFPLVPEGQSPSRTKIWKAENAPRPYDWGNYREAADILSTWRKEKHVLEPNFGAWVRQLLQLEGSTDFNSEWEEIKARLLSQNPPKLRPGKAASAWMPVNWYEKVQRLRSGL